MGGVDVTDQMLYQYLDERRTLKLWKKATCNIFGGLMINAYILYSFNTDKPLFWLDFMISIIVVISKEWLRNKSLPNSPDIFPGSQPDNISIAGGNKWVVIHFLKNWELINKKTCCVCSAQSIKVRGPRKKIYTSLFQIQKRHLHIFLSKAQLLKTFGLGLANIVENYFGDKCLYFICWLCNKLTYIIDCVTYKLLI